MPPTLCEVEMDLRTHIVLLKLRRGSADFTPNELSAALPMQLQLLDAVRQRAKKLKQSILSLPRIVQMAKTRGDEDPVADRAQRNEYDQRRQHFPGKPAEVDGAAE